jgi:hypothetical protein
MFPRRVSHVATTEVEGETIVLDREHGQVHQLNATASFIWQRCDGHTALTDIAAAVAREFGADPATAETDTVAAVRQMQALNLLDPDDGQATP